MVAEMSSRFLVLFFTAVNVENPYSHKYEVANRISTFNTSSAKLGYSF
jgi:hypothetical protein